MKLSLRGALGAAFILAMCAICVRLGVWQLDRLEQRRARNASLAARIAEPPLVLDAATVRAITADPARYVDRRARAVGSYDAAGEVVLRGRASGGKPGVHLDTPLVLAGGAAVLVNRGWVPSPDAASVDPRPHAEPGTRTVEGILQAIPETEDGGRPSETGARGARTVTYQRLDRAALGARSPRPLLPLYLQQLPGADPARGGQTPERVPLPPMDEGPHLGYAIQWFSFAAIGLVGLGILLRRSRPRSG